MIRIILSGCNGRMGNAITEYCKQDLNFQIVAGISKNTQRKQYYSTFLHPSECCLYADVLIDFSHPDAIYSVLSYSIEHQIPAVLGTTGYSSVQQEVIGAAGRQIPIFYAANYSIGANLLMRLVSSASVCLDLGYEANIIEHHHKNKLDSPSGTALLLSQSMGQNINIQSIRSGSVAGEHRVLFSAAHEKLELIHRAEDLSAYVPGVMRAAQFITNVNIPGLYSMEHLLRLR